MESITLLPLEPAHQLEDYFQTLGDIGTALADFERLADLVLASDDPDSRSNSSSPPSLATSVSSSSSAPSPFAASPLSSFSTTIASQTPSSPGGQSCASSVNCCASCTSNWPASRSANSFSSSASSSSISSSARCYSSSNFSGSPASSSSSLSYDDDDDDNELDCRRPSQSPASSSNSTGRRQACGANINRRKKNATAAERYRKRLKGRRSTLMDELKEEQERNSRLKQSLRAKLELYSEFADLLAQNTRDERDFELASLGSRSLASILECVCPADERLADPRRRSQLEQLLAHFRRIQSKSSPGFAFEQL